MNWKKELKSSLENDYCRELLTEIAKRYCKKGLTSKMTLSFDFHDKQRESAILRFFGSYARILENKQKATVNLANYFKASVKTFSTESWYKELCFLLKITPLKENKLDQNISTLFKSLKLLYDEKYFDAFHSEVSSRYSKLKNWELSHAKKYLTALAKCYQFLLNNKAEISYSHLGSDFFNDSKCLRDGELFVMLSNILQRYLHGEVLSQEKARRKEVFAHFGVIDNPTAIKVTLFGPLVYQKKGQIFDHVKCLGEIGECSVLTLQNLNEIEGLKVEAKRIITCENESPFFSLTSEFTDALIIYTEGFANRAVVKLLSLLASEGFTVNHWGDSDPEGLHIASELNQIIPITLWRCDVKELKRYKTMLKTLPYKKRVRGEKLLSKERFTFSEELEFTLKNGWLEQEAWKKI